ncbi:metallophosphoesterase [Enterococcus sp. LJL90]
MKYLVVSDNHGDRDVLVDLKNQYAGKVDYFFHCGDSELAPNDELWQTFYVVKGNCDFDPEFPDRRLVDTGADRVYMTHGHLSNVRFGLNHLTYEAQENQATIALFGHTHQIGCEKHQGILFLNPGSISQPRGPIQIQSYAIIKSTPTQDEVQYYRRNHQMVPDLHFVFKK